MLKFSNRYLSLTFIIVEIIIIKPMICFCEKLEINSIVVMISLLLIMSSPSFSSLLFGFFDFIIT